MERTRRRGLEVSLGLGLVCLMVAALVLIWESFSGAFSNKITISAQLSQAGDALGPGDIVTYRDVIVGEVTAASGKGDGGTLATLKIDPAQARVIPASVRAVALPASLFGLTRIELEPPADLSGPMLRGGDMVAADLSPAAESLQTALANAYTLLTSVHPAQLDAALSSLATALEDKGNELGQLVAQADTYLRRLAPSLPQLDSVVRSLATVTDEVARNAPAMLHSLGNLLTVSSTILADKQAIAATLAVAPAALQDAQALLNPTNVNETVTVVRDQSMVSQILAANPDALSKTIDGFKRFADTFALTTSSGPFLKTNIVLTGANLAEVLNVSLNSKGHLFDSIANPPLYTSADCPRYPGADGPNCGAAAGTNGSTARVLTTGSDYGGLSASVGSAQEVFTVRSTASTITGIPAAKIPDGVDLILGPLLRGTTTVIG